MSDKILQRNSFFTNNERFRYCLSSKNAKKIKSNSNFFLNVNMKSMKEKKSKLTSFSTQRNRFVQKRNFWSTKKDTLKTFSFNSLDSYTGDHEGLYTKKINEKEEIRKEVKMISKDYGNTQNPEKNSGETFNIDMNKELSLISELCNQMTIFKGSKVSLKELLLRKLNCNILNEENQNLKIPMKFLNYDEYNSIISKLNDYPNHFKNFSEILLKPFSYQTCLHLVNNIHIQFKQILRIIQDKLGKDLIFLLIKFWTNTILTFDRSLYMCSEYFQREIKELKNLRDVELSLFKTKLKENNCLKFNQCIQTEMSSKELDRLTKEKDHLLVH